MLNKLELEVNQPTQIDPRWPIHRALMFSRETSFELRAELKGVPRGAAWDGTLPDRLPRS